jgi:hypothetical protein
MLEHGTDQCATLRALSVAWGSRDWHYIHSVLHCEIFTAPDQLLWNAIWCAQLTTDVPSTHQNYPPHCSYIPQDHDSHISVHHTQEQSTAPTFRNFLSASSNLKMKAVRCYWIQVIPALTLLVHRLQNLRESSKFQDSAQQDLHTSAATHTTQCKPSGGHCLLRYFCFSYNKSCWSISSTHQCLLLYRCVTLKIAEQLWQYNDIRYMSAFLYKLKSPNVHCLKICRFSCNVDISSLAQACFMALVILCKSKTWCQFSLCYKCLAI